MKVGDKECSGGHATGFETKSAQTDTRPVSRQRVLRRTRDRFRDKECSGGHATGFETECSGGHATGFADFAFYMRSF